ncbi:hypothetical protein VC83_08800 [Pseudogymnoascus destructans]|uniref:Uncharacterized protein n=2 Tax=Pseudogymnoascus destructans TaxID=655981 RepID=L8FXV3_PSED2|nr:uncharacterized protein VC83_08800 [Pseudogymnoascus destructans]ELR05830.1 hypothetical protein GMDG_07603 [Pseudogymnoascus destructans 20631-21]OAF54648.1 hypothetical protein VC83_08800 [Pseudogymnoascus destructans]
MARGVWGCDGGADGGEAGDDGFHSDIFTMREKKGIITRKLAIEERKRTPPPGSYTFLPTPSSPSRRANNKLDTDTMIRYNNPLPRHASQLSDYQVVKRQKKHWEGTPVRSASPAQLARAVLPVELLMCELLGWGVVGGVVEGVLAIVQFLSPRTVLSVENFSLRPTNNVHESISSPIYAAVRCI